MRFSHIRKIAQFSVYIYIFLFLSVLFFLFASTIVMDIFHLVWMRVSLHRFDWFNVCPYRILLFFFFFALSLYLLFTIWVSIFMIAKDEYAQVEWKQSSVGYLKWSEFRLSCDGRARKLPEQNTQKKETATTAMSPIRLSQQFLVWFRWNENNVNCH